MASLRLTGEPIKPSILASVTTEELVIAAVRITGALLILRWALIGSITAILVDFSDLFLMNLLELGGVRDYQALDKALDLAYMATFLWVALRWSGGARAVAIGLFCYRILGVLVFELTSSRAVLLAFPNIFEFWVVFVAAWAHYRPNRNLTMRMSLIYLAPLTALKEAQEYVLHGARWLDNYRAVDVVQQWWRWLTNSA